MNEFEFLNAVGDFANGFTKQHPEVNCSLGNNHDLYIDYKPDVDKALIENIQKQFESEFYKKFNTELELEAYNLTTGNNPNDLKNDITHSIIYKINWKDLQNV